MTALAQITIPTCLIRLAGRSATTYVSRKSSFLACAYLVARSLFGTVLVGSAVAALSITGRTWVFNCPPPHQVQIQDLSGSSGRRCRFTAEVNRQNHGDDGYGAQHQNRKGKL